MISRLSKYIGLLLPLMGLTQGLEFGAYVEGGAMVTNSTNPTNLPVLIDYDEDFNDLEYFVTDWNITNSYGFGAFMGANIPQFNWTFGMQLKFSTARLSLNGYNDYTAEFYEANYGTYDDYNASQGGGVSQEEYEAYIDSKRPLHQSEYSILTRRNDPGILSVFVGKRLNTYKSWRPYFLGHFIMAVPDADNVISADLGNTNVLVTPNFNTAFTLRQQLQVGLTAGLEWKNWKLFANMTTPISKERLFSDTDSDGNLNTALPYSRWIRFNVGFGTRLNGPIRKPAVGYAFTGVIADETIKVRLNHRRAKFVEFGVGAAFYPITFVGVDFDNGASFLHLKRTTETLGTVTRERVHMEQVEIIFDPDAYGYYSGGVYGALKLGKKVKLHTNGFVRPLDIHVEVDETRVDMVEYSPGNYSVDPESWDYSNEPEFLLEYLEFGFQNRLSYLITIDDGRTEVQFMKISVGFEYNYLHLRDHYQQDGNTNNMELYRDVYAVMRGTETQGNLDDLWVNFNNSEIPYSAEEVYERHEEIYTPMAESEFITRKPHTWNTAISFGMEWSFRRLSAELGGGFYIGDWKGRTFFQGGGFMRISLNWLLYGY